MIAALLEFSLRQRLLILGIACLLSIAGVVAFQALPIDAYPDVTNIQVQLLTEGPGLSPVEVERFITYPLELQMTGLPRACRNSIVIKIRTLTSDGRVSG
jgi:cobalt-zinc-cadmium resistance protein CzcA